MDFKEFRQTLRTRLAVEEWRFELADFVEFVIRASERSLLEKMLMDYFGPPLDFHQPLPPEVTETAKKWGGFRGDQTVYFRVFPEIKELALLWPWCDKTRISVKIIQDKPLDRSVLWNG